MTSAKILLNLWKHECCRVIADRFINQSDKDWFEKALKQVAEEDYGDDKAALLDAEPYFVDFLRDAPEPTGILHAKSTHCTLIISLCIEFVML